MEAGFDRVLALGATESLLDVGCGDGAYLDGVRSSGHRGPLVGVDIAPELVAAARERQGRDRLVDGRAGAALETPPDIKFIEADAHALPFPDATFDAISARYVIDHLADPDAALAEAARVLSPGGRLVRVANAAGHLAEFWDLVPALAPGSGPALEDSFVALALRHFDEVSIRYLARTVRLPDAAVAVALLDTHKPARRAPADAEWAAARARLASLGHAAASPFPLSLTLRLCVVRAVVNQAGGAA